MTDTDELGDFEDYGDAPDSSTDSGNDGVEQDAEDRGWEIYDEMVEQIPVDELGDTDPAEVANAAAKILELERGGPEQNPVGIDPRVGEKDVAYDRAKPGAKLYVVQILAETVEDYYEEFPDAPALDEYVGNVVSGFDPEGAVFACVYLKDSLTSVDTNLTAYPMPESRLTRYPTEQASMVGSSSVEFERTRLPGETHRLDAAEPAEIPDDAERDEDGEAVLPDDAGSSPGAGEMDLSTALSCIATHGHTERAEEIREVEGLDSEEVYGL